MNIKDLTSYLALLPSEHADKPKFVAFVSLLAQACVDQQLVALQMLGRLDLDAAVGDQLDAVGVWVGMPRQLPNPVGGVSTLDDSTYRLLLYVEIAANMWDGTTEQAQTILQTLFALGAEVGVRVFIRDNQDMTMTVGIIGVPINPVFASIIAAGYFNLRPAGVGFSVLTSPGPLFGLDFENGYIAGFDTGYFA